MTLEQISDVSQAVAAVAVVLSLVALILETRQNTKMMDGTVAEINAKRQVRAP